MAIVLEKRGDALKKEDFFKSRKVKKFFANVHQGSPYAGVFLYYIYPNVHDTYTHLMGIETILMASTNLKDKRLFDGENYFPKIDAAFDKIDKIEGSRIIGYAITDALPEITEN